MLLILNKIIIKSFFIRKKPFFAFYFFVCKNIFLNIADYKSNLY